MLFRQLATSVRRAAATEYGLSLPSKNDECRNGDVSVNGVMEDQRLFVKNWGLPRL